MNIVKRNIKNTVKNEPWPWPSSATLGSQLPSSAHKDLPNPLDQVKTSVLELDKVTVEERQYEEYGKFDVLQEEPENIEDFAAEMSAL